MPTAWLLLAKTTQPTPARLAASKTLYVPMMLSRRTSSHGDVTEIVAARWTTASMPSNAGSIAARSEMLATTLGNSAGLCVIDTSSYRSSRCSRTAVPITPAAPVTSTRIVAPQPVSRSVRQLVSYQLSAISYQLSAISYQLSAISYQLSAISYQLSAIS